VHGPDQARAQFTDPHNYDNAPVGINQVELGYAFAHGNASIDTSVAIAGANIQVNQETLDYTRYFGVRRRVMWAEATVPVAHLGGSIADTNVEESTAGAGDATFALAMLLTGGPALGVTDFDTYRLKTALGVSLTVTAPIGLYRADRILNLGADRWAFKPEVALSHRFGPTQKWQLDAYANEYFFTDNTAHHGRQILRQEPLAGFEGHLSYSFTDSAWVAVNTRYAFRGTTFVDGVDQNNGQQNVIVGSEVNMSIDSRHSLSFEFVKTVVHQNSPAVTELQRQVRLHLGQGQ
jgi:hypothetical protein